MNAPHWPAEDAVVLYERFLEMRFCDSYDRRLNLAFRLVLLRGSRDRIRRACATFGRCQGNVDSVPDEVLQEAGFILARRAAGVALRFEDRGPACFIAWYKMLCRNVARRAWEKYRGPQFVSLDRLPEDQIPLCSEPTLVEQHWTDVVRAIQTMPDLQMQAVMADLSEGTPAWKTAEKCGISPWDVSRQRNRGIAYLQNHLRQEIRDYDE